MKKVRWVASALDDLKALPKEVQSDIGFILDRVQRGMHHPRIKNMKGLAGVQEIRVDFNRDTYRGIYTVKFGDYVYVLHVFKKKSKQGISTPKSDVEIVRQRLKAIQKGYNGR